MAITQDGWFNDTLIKALSNTIALDLSNGRTIMPSSSAWCRLISSRSLQGWSAHATRSK